MLAFGGCATTADRTDAAASSVGGAAMYADRTVMANLRDSPLHFTLTRALATSDLAATLDGPGPYTLFAPTDRAFERLAEGALATLLMPESRAQLNALLSAHVVPGRITAADIRAKMRASGGSATYTTLAGEPLTFREDGGGVLVVERGGGSALVTQLDVMQSNGVMHVVNGVLAPPG